MSSVDELLDGLNSGGESLAPEEHIVVGTDRFITVPTSLRKIAVAGDKDVETVTFDCPRYWDDGRVDLSTMAIYINYMRGDGGADKYHAYDAAVDEDDPTVIHFTWIVSEYAAAIKGSLSFLISAKLVNEDGEEIQKWHSELNSELTVSAGLDADEAIATKNPSTITQILLRLDRIEGNGGGSGGTTGGGGDSTSAMPVRGRVSVDKSGWQSGLYARVLNFNANYFSNGSVVVLIPSDEDTRKAASAAGLHMRVDLIVDSTANDAVIIEMDKSASVPTVDLNFDFIIFDSDTSYPPVVTLVGIDAYGIVSDALIASAVEKYLEEHPITGDTNATKPKIADVTLLSSGWIGDASPYSQVVSVEGVTPNSQVDLTPSVEQLSIFHQKDLAFVTENDNGVVTVYAIGDRPANDYVIQATITEVSV